LFVLIYIVYNILDVDATYGVEGYESDYSIVAGDDAAAAYPAEEAVSAAGEWQEYLDESTGFPYWINPGTGETTWENPY
jgi:hypothetical protein